MTNRSDFPALEKRLRVFVDVLKPLLKEHFGPVPAPHGPLHGQALLMVGDGPGPHGAATHDGVPLQDVRGHQQHRAYRHRGPVLHQGGRARSVSAFICGYVLEFSDGGPPEEQVLHRGTLAECERVDGLGSQIIARQGLRGVGDASLGEWHEQGASGIYHMRRRLSDAERERWPDVREMRDIRGTAEESKRTAALRAAFPAALPPRIAAMFLEGWE